PSTQSAALNSRVSTDEEGVDTARRNHQFQGFGYRPVNLVELQLDSASIGYRFALELLRRDRLNRFSVWIMVLLRGPQLFENSPPSFVAGIGKIAFHRFHRGFAHSFDTLRRQREEIFDLVGQRADIASRCDVAVLPL